MTYITLADFRRMRFLFPLLVAFLTGGCCIRSVTSVHNITGRDVSLTVVRKAGHDQTFALKSDASILIDQFTIGEPTALIVTDTGFRYLFADISAVQHLPTRYVSGSRFTSDFQIGRA